jgi:hypothetical protein
LFLFDDAQNWPRTLRDLLFDGGLVNFPPAAGAQLERSLRSAFRDHDERARAADDVVPVVACKPTGRISVVRIETGLRLGQDDETIDRDALAIAPFRADITAAIVIAISRNVDDAAARFVGSRFELRHREVDRGADRRAVGKYARRLDNVITEQTRRLIIADHHPIDHDPL